MNNWLTGLFNGNGIAQSVLIFGLIISTGVWLGRIKLFGISLGVTWVLFAGMFFSWLGVTVDEKTEQLLKEFGLILFVYAIGLQVGPGFFASLKKHALANNLLAAMAVVLGVLITVIFFCTGAAPVAVITGIMSGAVTNTPGLAAAQAAAANLNTAGSEKSMIALAYALTYPFGVFGIIGSLLVLKKVMGVNIKDERELHRKLEMLRPNRLISRHFHLENKMLSGQPLSRLFDMLKEKVIVSRLLHNGVIITPGPDTLLAENDVLLIVASKKETEQLKLVVGPESNIDLKTAADSNLVAKTIVVTRKSVTHKRLGDLPELGQHQFTFTRLNRAGVEMVPHGNSFLQLGDTLKVVGTAEGVDLAAITLGNSVKRLELPDLAPIFLGIVLGVLLGSLPLHFPGMPVAVRIGMAGGPLVAALLLSRFGSLFYLNNYTTNSANLMIREMGITLFLAGVGLSSGKNLPAAFAGGNGLWWALMGIGITVIPLLVTGLIARKYFRKTYFEICGLLAGASTDPPALAFANRLAGSDIPSATYATVYPLTMILRIIAAQLLILVFA